MLELISLARRANNRNLVRDYRSHSSRPTNAGRIVAGWQQTRTDSKAADTNISLRPVFWECVKNMEVGGTTDLEVGDL